jgi:hypothetical protein
MPEGIGQHYKNGERNMPAAYCLTAALLAFAIGYFVAAKLHALPEDLAEVVEAFGAVDRVNACHRAGLGAEGEADFPGTGNALGAALVKAAAARGMKRGLLLGFVAGAK